jgi:hypothetical protein
MKNKIAAIFILVIISLQNEIQPARALAGNPCAPDPGIVKFKGDEEYGFDITNAKKDYPEYPIVIGQDMKEQTGVDITIEIQSAPGKIAYETFDGYGEECVGQAAWEDGPKSCPPYYSNNQYFYLRQVPKCTSHEEEVYRTIIGETVKVWLIPTEETLNWLGWNAQKTGDKYPLRFLFPEKWALGTWTPGGFTTVGSDYMFTEEQIDAFIAKNPGFEFLKGDPRMEDIPTYALQRAEDPSGNPMAAQRVLALFGEFTNWYTHTATTAGGPCLVDRTGTQGHCQTATNLSMGNSKTVLFNADLGAEGITYLRVELLNVPMDLPGDWYIGVNVSVWPAKYDNGRRTETVADPSLLHRDPAEGYTLKDHIFTTYILVSTLCNSAEIGGCET